MRDKIITIIIKTLADIVAVILVFYKFSDPIVSCLIKIGIKDSKAQLIVISSIASALGALFLIGFGYFIFNIILKPINVKVNFSDERNKNISNKKITLSKNDFLNYQLRLRMPTNIFGGNKATNRLLSWIGSEMIIIYQPESFDTETDSGWSNSNKSKLYEDKGGKIRYCWYECINGLDIIKEDEVVLKPSIVLKPKGEDLYKCKVGLKFVGSQKKNVFKRVLFFIFGSFLINTNIQPLYITINVREE